MIERRRTRPTAHGRRRSSSRRRRPAAAAVIRPSPSSAPRPRPARAPAERAARAPGTAAAAGNRLRKRSCQSGTTPCGVRMTWTMRVDPTISGNHSVDSGVWVSSSGPKMRKIPPTAAAPTDADADDDRDRHHRQRLLEREGSRAHRADGGSEQAAGQPGQPGRHAERRELPRGDVHAARRGGDLRVPDRSQHAARLRPAEVPDREHRDEEHRRG